MRALLQRVSRASVVVSGEQVGAIGRGLLVLVGVGEGDEDRDVEWLVRKLSSLRVFPDEAGKMNLSLVDVAGSALLVSQFTLCADVGKGTRPSFGRAMEPVAAAGLFDRLVAELGKHCPVATGRFGAHMEVELLNDGPVTLWLDSRPRGAAA